MKLLSFVRGVARLDVVCSWSAGLVLATCVATAPRLAGQTYTFSTFAGTVSNDGSADGVGAAARFNRPGGVALDSSGNVYVADTNNNTIRKVSFNGTVTTLAGSPGQAGSADGTGVAARFNGPRALAVDSSGSIYVADTGNSTIRRVTNTGVVTTVAGLALTPGSTDGAVGSARFNQPQGIAVDAAGNIYVADTGNHTIRKIGFAGVVTIAGTAGTPGSADGFGTAASFNLPHGLAADGVGNLYVADTGNNLIRQITPAGAVSTLAGNTGTSTPNQNGTGSAASFSSPFGVAIDLTGNVYVADTFDNTVRVITPAGVVTTLAGSTTSGSTDGSGSTARFNLLTGVAVDFAGNIYVADTANSTIRKVSSFGSVMTLAGSAGAPGSGTDGTGSAARFNNPRGLAADLAGNVYVADSGNHTIRKITPDGVVTTLAGLAGISGSTDGTGSAARFNAPQGVAVDGNGNVYVADTGNKTIRKITATGVVTTLAGSAGNTGSTDSFGSSARFTLPLGVAVDAQGNLYVSDGGGVSVNGGTVTIASNTIRKISSAGLVFTLAGQAGTHGTNDGTGALARFELPDGVAVDANGNVYVADGGQILNLDSTRNDNSTVRKITSAGVVTTLAGSSGNEGSSDGTGSAAKFANPEGVVLDFTGNLYIADTNNHTLRRVTSMGVVTTIAGLAGTAGSTDGAGNAARFNFPSGIAIDGSGNIYVADSANNTIRKGTPTPDTGSTARLTNLSVHATVLASQKLTVGFVTIGGPKPMLLRAVGPGLAPFVPAGSTLAGDPNLQLFDSNSVVIQSNDNWGGGAALSTAFAKAGAFALTPTSLDAAFLTTASGKFTAQAGVTSDGLALIEAYDMDLSAASRLINLSCRYRVSSGNGALVAGFALTGTGQRTVLIRGIGPTLANYGVTGALSDPKLQVFDSSQREFAENDNWSSTNSSAMASAGAFSLPSGSRDAVLVLTLPVGVYTVQLTGVGATAGEGLIEVYEVQ